MEPWLDSLSEDWCSEKQSSSPVPSINSHRLGNSVGSNTSQSRIPHLAHSLRRDASSTGSFLRPRSSRGIARSKGEAALTERSASSLNLQAGVPENHKRIVSTAGSRRASSAFSISQTSVQHHTIDEKAKRDEYTPEWKQRLAAKENLKNQNLDLFAPSQLEGIFAQNPSNTETTTSLSKGNRPQLWKSLTVPLMQNSDEQYQSLRASRSRPPGMDVLQEVDEDGGLPDMSAISSDLARTGSLRGLVRQRVQTLEEASFRDSVRSLPEILNNQRSASTHLGTDPRWRTISGQEEIRNEMISPVTSSKQNTIREKVLSESLDFDVESLRDRLINLPSRNLDRPSSSSSDRDISYGPVETRTTSGREQYPDMTSQSLPEDLSMGTEDFVSHGGYVNHRRGGYSNETSFLHRQLSPSPQKSRDGSILGPQIHIQSSPPPFRMATSSGDQSRISMSLPTTPKDDSVVHHMVKEPRATSLSPLKLFGNRDTYTNKKLMRILSHFEDPDEQMLAKQAIKPQEQQSMVNFRMSQFGEGELDTFTFEQEIVLPEAEDNGLAQGVDKIFISTKISSPQAAPNSRPAIETDVLVTLNEPKSDVANGKDRFTKRRRTLVDGMSDFVPPKLEVVAEPSHTSASLAGKKRKDANPGAEGIPADPDVLASRTLLEPKVVRRNSVTNNRVALAAGDSNDEKLSTIEENLTEALAAELASFAHEVAEVQSDSRKPSLATKDYMEEANKVMQFIRARGKPTTPRLPEIPEPSETSDLEADAILDLDLDDDSTKDEFSRPPSREGKSQKAADRRQSKHDSKTADYLRQYEDHDDFDQLNSASIAGTLQLHNDAEYERSRKESVESQKSKAGNARMNVTEETLRKRKYSSSTVDGPHGHLENRDDYPTNSSDNSTRHTFPTNSSSSNGNRGVIASGTVSIPDKVGVMTFDHQRKIWVKSTSAAGIALGKAKSGRQNNSEEDPFQDIPDLSIDETSEGRMQIPDRGDTQDVKSLNQLAVKQRIEQRIQESLLEQSLYEEKDDDKYFEQQAEHNTKDEADSLDENQGSIKSAASKHEARLHNGIPSRPPATSQSPNKQPRVVTIAFSSPVVSAVQYPEEPSMSEADLNEEDDLPLDDSGITVTPVKTNIVKKMAEPVATIHKPSMTIPDNRHEKYRAMTVTRRPPSPIDESEEVEQNFEMSLVRVQSPDTLVQIQETPAKDLQIIKTGNSMLCLTPLSEFTLNQIDNARHNDESYVEERAGPQSLRHAHGSHALAVDALVQAITDAVPTEAYWDQIQSLRLPNRQLTTLHSLKEYCSTLEVLDARRNAVSELAGLPPTLRMLDIQANILTNLTSWGHLHNLQYVDVSQNQLENLEGFASLVHLRSLKANDNRLRDIEGVLDLDGLLELEISGNELVELDFQGVNLPRLRKLDVSKNRLAAVRNLHLLPELEELNLAHNTLTALDVDSTIRSSAIRKLDISHNNLSEFQLNDVPQLQCLNLDNNRIAQVHGLKDARDLAELSLEHQHDSLDIVNTILSTPNDCHNIRLSWNAIPGGIPALPSTPQYNLRKIELAGCGIAGLPNGFGDFFPNCRRLNVDYNALKGLSALLGMIKLEDLCMARNRIQRMRRTCLVLSRLPSISKIDLRDNPLTLGFYPPRKPQSHPDVDGDNAYENQILAEQEDRNWISVLDETTRLKRNMMRLLLAETCTHLTEVDGMAFSRDVILHQEQTFVSLKDKGVLALPTVADPSSISPSNRQEIRRDASRIELAANNPWDFNDKFDIKSGDEDHELMSMKNFAVVQSNWSSGQNEQEDFTATATTMTVPLRTLAM